MDCPSLLHIGTTTNSEKESGELRVDVDSEFPIYIGNEDEDNGDVYLIRVYDRRVEIRREHQDVPMYRIANESSVNILYNQAGSKTHHLVKHAQSRTIGWDVPARPPHLTIRLCSSAEGSSGSGSSENISTTGTPFTFDMNRVGLQTEMKHQNGTVSARTETDGPTLVLRIRDVLSDTEWIVLEKGRRRRRRRRSTKLQLQKELSVMTKTTCPQKNCPKFDFHIRCRYRYLCR